jgi:recombination protein RecA
MKKKKPRIQLPAKKPENIYEAEDPRTTAIERISSGCVYFDMGLGGGWAKGRVINIVGVESSGKTQLAIELCANFVRQYGPKVRIRYRDAEEAFDVPYAESVGLPKDIIDFGDGSEFETVQDFARCVQEFITSTPKNIPGVYILDSLDSLSEEGEMRPKIDRVTGEEKGSMGMEKAKAMSKLFRRLVRRLGRKDVTLVILSQLRDAVDVSYGEKQTRTGGKALNYYASQIAWLSVVSKIFKTRKKVSRPVGIWVKAKIKKNKAGDPFHEIEYPIYFRFGIDDVRAGLTFLADVQRMDMLGMEELNGKAEAEKKGWGSKKAGNAALTRFFDKLDQMETEEYKAFRTKVNKAVRIVWREIDGDFAPKRRKY